MCKKRRKKRKKLKEYFALFDLGFVFWFNFLVFYLFPGWWLFCVVVLLLLLFCVVAVVVVVVFLHVFFLVGGCFVFLLYFCKSVVH